MKAEAETRLGSEIKSFFVGRRSSLVQIIWDESLLLSNCARSLEYSSSSTLAGLSYHICGKLEVDFKASPSSQHQHCTDEAQKDAPDMS